MKMSKYWDWPESASDMSEHARDLCSKILVQLFGFFLDFRLGYFLVQCTVGLNYILIQLHKIQSQFWFCWRVQLPESLSNTQTYFFFFKSVIKFMQIMPVFFHPTCVLFLLSLIQFWKTLKSKPTFNFTQRSDQPGRWAVHSSVALHCTSQTLLYHLRGWSP